MTIRKLILPALLALIGLSSPLSAQDVQDGFTVDIAGGDVYTIARGYGGRVLLGGNFDSVQGQTRQRVALLWPNGTVHPYFNPNLANGTVLAGLAHSSGDFLFAGSFTSPHTRLARYDIGGDPVPGFGVNIDGTVRALIEDADSGQIYIGGDFSQVGGQTRSRVARLNQNGAPDSGFVPPEFLGAIRALVRQPDGKLIVAGNIQRVGDVGPRRLYRLNADGSWDNSFMVTSAVGAPHEIRSIALQADGRILVGGDFPGHLRRYNPDGSLDAGYSPPALNSTVLSIDLQPDGRALIGGDFTGVDGRLRIIRLNEDGSLDSGFRTLPSPTGAIRAVEVQPDGSVMIGGDFTQLADPDRNRLARLSATGFIDQNLEVPVSPAADFELVNSIGEAGDGSLIVAGDFTRLGGVARTHIARVLPDGTIASDFQPLLDRYVRALAIQSDGKILIGGRFTTVNGQGRHRLARLNPDGSLDAGFANPLGGGGVVQSIAFQEDGRILVAGSIQLDNSNVSGIVRLNPNGTPDAGFTPPDFDGSIRTMLLDESGAIIVGGDFTSADGSPRQGLAMLSANGSLDSGFAPQVDSAVRALALIDGKILAGGNFSEIDGNACRRLARIAPNGAVEACDNPGFGVHAIVPRADGRFYAGGRNTVNGNSTAFIKLFSSVGSQEAGFDTVSGADALVKALMIQRDGRLVAGGTFSALNGEARGGLARVRVNQDVDQSLAWDLGSEEVLWRRGPAGQRRIGPDPIGRARVLVSPACCDPGAFEPVPGGGWMTRTGLDNWVLQGFEGLPGKFYMQIESQVGDERGAGTYALRTPVHRFDGPPPPVIAADLSVKLVASQDPVEPGDVFEIFVQAGNSGPETASEPSVTIELPAGYSLIDFDDSDQGTFLPGDMLWKLDDLPGGGAGSDATLVLQVQVTPEGPYRVRAEIGAGEFDPDYNNNQAELNPGVLRSESDLKLVHDVLPGAALPGDQVEFVVTLGNLGPDPASGVEVQHVLPTGYSYQGHSLDAGSFDWVTGQWQVGLLPPGGDAMLEVQALVNADGGYLSSASADSYSNDPVAENNLDFAEVDPFTDLAVEIEADTEWAGMDEQVVLTVRVENNGPREADGATVQLQPLAGGLMTVSYSASAGSYDPASAVWSLGSLSDDESAELVIEGQVVWQQDTEIGATVSSDTFDLDTGNDSASVLVRYQYPGPVGEIAPASIDFGQVVVGQSSDPVVITVTSIGDEPLQMISTSLWSPDEDHLHFEFDGSGCTSSAPPLAAGMGCTAALRFVPKAEGVWTEAEVRISSNDPDSPLVIPISGTGVSDSVEDTIFSDRFRGFQ